MCIRITSKPSMRSCRQIIILATSTGCAAVLVLDVAAGYTPMSADLNCLVGGAGYPVVPRHARDRGRCLRSGSHSIPHCTTQPANGEPVCELTKVTRRVHRRVKRWDRAWKGPAVRRTGPRERACLLSPAGWIGVASATRSLSNCAYISSSELDSADTPVI